MMKDSNRALSVLLVPSHFLGVPRHVLSAQIFSFRPQVVIVAHVEKASLAKIAETTAQNQHAHMDGARRMANVCAMMGLQEKIVRL
jgi:hypothetical protein